MFKKIKAKIRNKKGFTLVELLIVIAVLGIIAAIAVPRFTGVLGNVRTNAEIRSAELIVKEVEAEFMLEGWAIADGVTMTLAAPTAAAADNTEFNGTIPLDEHGVAMTITITNTGGVFTITISDGDTTPHVLTGPTVINGPVN